MDPLVVNSTWCGSPFTWLPTLFCRFRRCKGFTVSEAISNETVRHFMGSWLDQVAWSKCLKCSNFVEFFFNLSICIWFCKFNNRSECSKFEFKLGLAPFKRAALSTPSSTRLVDHHSKFAFLGAPRRSETSSKSCNFSELFRTFLNVSQLQGRPANCDAASYPIEMSEFKWSSNCKPNRSSYFTLWTSPRLLRAEGAEGAEGALHCDVW